MHHPFTPRVSSVRFENSLIKNPVFQRSSQRFRAFLNGRVRHFVGRNALKKTRVHELYASCWPSRTIACFVSYTRTWSTRSDVRLRPDATVRLPPLEVLPPYAPIRCIQCDIVRVHPGVFAIYYPNTNRMERIIKKKTFFRFPHRIDWPLAHRIVLSLGPKTSRPQ